MRKVVFGRQDACPPNDTPSAYQGPKNPYYNKDEAKIITISHLPHISERQKIYAVTFRLHDSLPQHIVMSYMQECEKIFGEDSPSFKTKRDAMLHKKMMELMDAGYGECILKEKSVRRIVEEGFEYIDNNMVSVHAYVIMPNHVHAVLETLGETNIQQVIHTLKSYSALRINKCMHRDGCVWQRDYYDRIIRNDTHYANAINYINNNPRYCLPGEYTLSLGGELKDLL